MTTKPSAPNNEPRQNLIDSMTSDEELLSKYLDYQLTQESYYEKDLRGNVINYVSTITTGIVVFLPSEKLKLINELYVGWFLILVGIIGAFFNAKSHERFWFHHSRARELMMEINKMHPNLDVTKIIADADKKSKDASSKFLRSYLKLYMLWILLSLVTSIVGILVLVSYFKSLPQLPQVSNLWYI